MYDTERCGTDHTPYTAPAHGTYFPASRIPYLQRKNANWSGCAMLQMTWPIQATGGIGGSYQEACSFYSRAKVAYPCLHLLLLLRAVQAGFISVERCLAYDLSV